jgi:hypothetical protein
VWSLRSITRTHPGGLPLSDRPEGSLARGDHTIPEAMGNGSMADFMKRNNIHNQLNTEEKKRDFLIMPLFHPDLETFLKHTL